MIHFIDFYCYYLLLQLRSVLNLRRRSASATKLIGSLNSSLNPFIGKLLEIHRNVKIIFTYVLNEEEKLETCFEKNQLESCCEK